MREAAIGIALLLSGCVTVAPVTLADGSQGHNIQCGGTALNFSHCLAKAGELCGTRGYNVVNQQGDAAPFSIGSGTMSANQYGASAGMTATSGAIVTRNLFVQCKK